jgi:hypothetical protein
MKSWINVSQAHATLVSAGRLLLLLTLSSALLQAGVAQAEEKQSPLASSLGAPDWLRIGLNYRVRYEALDDSFRAGTSGPDRLLVERLLLSIRAEGKTFYLGAELQDSRTQLDKDETPLGTDDSNAAELLQGYFGYRMGNLIAEGDMLDLTAGRMTIDVGTRRLVARNDFRNTINSFTGFQAVWKGSKGTRLQTFYTLPVDRRPTDRDDLEDDEIDADEESRRIRFWGIDVTQEKLVFGVNAELFLFGLDERDGRGIETTDRDLLTPGFRLWNSPKDPWSFEIEAATQFGDSRRTAATSDVRDLDHSARFLHLHVARQLSGPWSPRFVAQYDYASGDDDSADGDNERFDTLFGARRFDFGPTGIYGALARTNLQSPGVRLEVKPSETVNGFIGYRAVYLADKTDTFTTAGVRDATGSSGSFIGHQFEARVRKNLMNGRLQLDVGGAYLSDGRFLREAPNATGGGGTLYGYVQATLNFQ